MCLRMKIRFLPTGCLRPAPFRWPFLMSARIGPRDTSRSAGKMKYSNQMTFETAWAKQRVTVLDAVSAKMDFSSFVDNLQPPRGSNRYDFLVVHQGDLDKIFDAIPESFELLWKRLKAKARWVVIETGRGKPELAHSEGLRWVEYSNLAEILFHGSKLDLVSFMFALHSEIT